MRMLGEVAPSEPRRCGIVLFEGDADKRRVEMELENRFATDNDPERPPKNAPKDKWLRAGILAGLVAGAAAGAIVGHRYSYLSGGSVLLLGLFTGALAGVIVGGMVGVAASYAHSVLVRKHPSQTR